MSQPSKRFQHVGTSAAGTGIYRCRCRSRADAAAAPLMAEQAHGMAIDVTGRERIAKLEAKLDAKKCSGC